MIGVAFTSLQASGVTTTFVTVLDIRWQPAKSADIELGFFIDQATFLAGHLPVFCQYFALDISLIDPTAAIPPQIFAQVVAGGGPCPGGTSV